MKIKKGSFSHPSGKKNSLNDLTGSEWAQLSKSVMEYPDKRSKKQKQHGAAFPESLVEHQILCYTKKGDKVLDPFAGVGTTLDVCRKLNRSCIGIELNPTFVELAKKDLSQKTLTTSKTKLQIINDDVKNLLKHLKPNSIDFIITSPPYSNLLRNVQGKFLYKWKKFGKKEKDAAKPYTDLENDIGNMSYDGSLEYIQKVFHDTFRVIKNNCYAAWVVKDFRDLKNGRPYVDFHSDVVSLAIQEGWKLWDIRIYDQTRFRPLVILGIPSRNFYMNIGHSYILIFKKDIDAAKKQKTV